MAQTFEVVYLDDFDNKTVGTVNGAPGQTIYLPPGWIAVSWTDYGDPQAPVNRGPLYYSSQQTADAAQARGDYP